MRELGFFGLVAVVVIVFGLVDIADRYFDQQKNKPCTEQVK